MSGFRIIAASGWSTFAIRGCWFFVGCQRRRCRQTIAGRAVDCGFAARFHSVLPPRQRCSRPRATSREGFGVKGRAVARTLNGRPLRAGRVSNPPLQLAPLSIREGDGLRLFRISSGRGRWPHLCGAAPGLLVGASDLLRIRAPRQISLPDRFLVCVSPEPLRLAAGSVARRSCAFAHAFRVCPARGPVLCRLVVNSIEKESCARFPFRRGDGSVRPIRWLIKPYRAP